MATATGGQSEMLRAASKANRRRQVRTIAEESKKQTEYLRKIGEGEVAWEGLTMAASTDQERLRRINESRIGNGLTVLSLSELEELEAPAAETGVDPTPPEAVLKCSVCGRVFPESLRVCPEHHETPPDPPPVIPEVKATQVSKANAAVILVVVGVVVALYLIGNHSTSTPAGGTAGATFQVSNAQALVTPSNEWEITLSLTNTGSGSGNATCQADFYDAQGAILAETFIPYQTPQAVSPNQTVPVAWITGLTPGANPVANVKVICTPA